MPTMPDDDQQGEPERGRRCRGRTTAPARRCGRSGPAHRARPRRSRCRTSSTARTEPRRGRASARPAQDAPALRRPGSWWATGGAAARAGRPQPAPRARRARAAPRPFVSLCPVPMRSVTSPSTRWIGDAVRSTVRTRSRGAESDALVHEPVAHLDAGRRDPVARREVAQEAESDGNGDADQPPPTAVGRRGRRPGCRPRRAGTGSSSRTGWTSSIRGSSRCQPRALSIGSIRGTRPSGRVAGRRSRPSESAPPTISTARCWSSPSIGERPGRRRRGDAARWPDRRGGRSLPRDGRRSGPATSARSGARGPTSRSACRPRSR